jgi:chromosome segregation ATPase
MEQQTDRLETHKRQLESSLGQSEGRLNSTLERLAFVENELESKRRLEADFQRLQDELRDMRNELDAVNRQHTLHNNGVSDVPSPTAASVAVVADPIGDVLTRLTVLFVF